MGRHAVIKFIGIIKIKMEGEASNRGNTGGL